MVETHINPEAFRNEWCLPEEAAEILGIACSTLRRYCRFNPGFLDQVRDERTGLIAVSRKLVEEEADYRAANGSWKTLLLRV